MPNCIDCMHFKMKKGWKHAYCSRGVLTNARGAEDRLFPWETRTAKKRNKKLKFEYQTTLIDRAKYLYVLEHPLGLGKTCKLFDCYK